MGNTLRILFVDASADDVEIAGWRLQQADVGADIVRVETPAALRAALQAAPVDLVVGELVVPGSDGSEVLQITRELRPDVPVIFYSGYPEANACRQALQCGGRACVSKDDTDHFIRVVKNLLSLR